MSGNERSWGVWAWGGLKGCERGERGRGCKAVCVCVCVHVGAATVEKQQRQHCLINQHQKTALKMNETRSNSLAKVNYSGVQLTPLPNNLLRTKILFFSSFSCPHLVSVCTMTASSAAENQSPRFAQGILGKQLSDCFSGSAV